MRGEFAGVSHCVAVRCSVLQCVAASEIVMIRRLPKCAHFSEKNAHEPRQ